MNALVVALLCAFAQKQVKPEDNPASYPPPAVSVSESSELFLKPSAPLKAGVEIARTAPRVDFSYVPGQDYPGAPWSCWGGGRVVDGKYYLTLGDHLALGKDKDPKMSGNARVFEYDPATRGYRKLVDLKEHLNLPPGQYTPGKIHSRLDLGEDGWLYFSTHRGSVTATRKDEHPFFGDFILRVHPSSGKTETVARGPVPKHSLPNGYLDPRRLIWYGGTIGPDSYDGPVHFFAYDVKAGRTLYASPDGPARSMIVAKSTGRLYFVPGAGAGPLMRYDPATPSEPPVKLPVTLDVRCTTDETADGLVYGISKESPSKIYVFDTKTEKLREIGEAPVGSQNYIASLDLDPNGRYLYYAAGAHGGTEKDGTPVVQFDLKTGTRKVLAFLHPYFKERHGATLAGTFAVAIDPSGGKLFITWNVNRLGGRAWDSVAVSVIHLPESERRP